MHYPTISVKNKYMHISIILTFNFFIKHVENNQESSKLFPLYLSYGSAMVISVAVESCQKLCLAPCGEDPDGFFMVALFLLDRFMKNISFSFGQFCIDLISTIPICGHQPNQQLHKAKTKHRLKTISI